MIDGLCELTFEARDVASVTAFYRDAVGLEQLDDEGDRTWLAVGGRCRLGIWSPGEKEFGDEDGAHVHFTARDAGAREGVRALADD